MAEVIDTRRGRFGTGRRFSAHLPSSRLKRGFLSSVSTLIGDRTVGVGLADKGVKDQHVLRAASSVAIALTLAIGPDAALLCELWCVQNPVAAAECQHGDPAPSSRVAATDDCCEAVAVAAILPRDARGSLISPHADFAIPGHFRLAARVAASVQPGHQPGRRWSLNALPLVTTLRI